MCKRISGMFPKNNPYKGNLTLYVFQVRCIWIIILGKEDKIYYMKTNKRTKRVKIIVICEEI